MKSKPLHFWKNGQLINSKNIILRDPDERIGVILTF